MREGLFFRILGIIWVSPATILVWLFYVLPVWLIWKDLVFIGWAEPGVAEFQLATSGMERWHVRLWRDWAGWSGPCVFITKDRGTRTRLHELEHCHQQLRWGILHYPIYLLCSISIWIFNPSKHAYLDNPFERGARAAAGQPVDIPAEYWPQGPGDRWPWW